MFAVMALVSAVPFLLMTHFAAAAAGADHSACSCSS